jgi:succinate dehydrogenase / fumarate reductase flavoprotein subunit
MRHGVVRRGDQIPLQIVHTDEQVHGIIALDMSTGTVNPLQAKCVIIADGGYEGAWTGTSIGLGLDMAMRTGMSARNLEFVSWTPMAVPGTNVVLPVGMLSDGASLHHPNGNPLEVEEFADTTSISIAMGAQNIALDARNMGESEKWWAQTSELVSTRLGINMARQTIPVSAQVSTTLGGIVTDEQGRAISGKWSRWFTGLYAAGDAACSGIHGAGMVAGNRLLDALTGGHISGLHAAEYASKTNFSGRAALETQLGVSEADLDFEMAGAEEGPVQRAGPLFAKLTEIMTSHVGMNRDADGLNEALEALNSLESSAANLHVDDNSRLFNSNLLEALRIKAGIRLAKATVHSALSRTESRGVHQRTDFTETDSEQMHHTLVDIEGNISTLAIRKGSAGSWVLTPEE